MSFDLYFCWRKDERIDFKEVKAWAAGYENFKLNDPQFWYQNPKTGVYFGSNSKPPGSLEDSSYIPDVCFDSGLSFNLNYNRPSYFGFEAMPVVEKLAARFALSAFDPQATGDEPDLLVDLSSEILVRSWLSADTFRGLVTGYIKPFQWPDPRVEMIGPESAEKVGKIIHSIDQTLPRSEWEVIGTDAFVDVEMPGDQMTRTDGV